MSTDLLAAAMLQLALKQREKASEYGGTECTGAARGIVTFVGLRDLSNKLGPAHIHRLIDLAGLRPRIVLENVHHQGCVIGDDDTCLQYAEQSYLFAWSR
jgi:hypothetical protein